MRKSQENRLRDDFSYVNEYSLPALAGKRKQDSVDDIDAIEVNSQGAEDSRADVHQPKKLRLEDMFSVDPHHQAQLDTIARQSDQINVSISVRVTRTRLC
jgi:hypothetical protein